MTGKLSMADIGNQFVSASNDGQNRFGKYLYWMLKQTDDW